MKPIILLSAAVCLSACSSASKKSVSATAPYHDIDPVRAEEYSRKYIEVLAASAWPLIDDTKEVLVCGALGNYSTKPGITINSILKHVRFQHPGFYNVAVCPPRKAAFFGVRFDSNSVFEPSPSIRTVSSSETLEAGDAVIVLAKAFAF